MPSHCRDSCPPKTPNHILFLTKGLATSPRFLWALLARGTMAWITTVLKERRSELKEPGRCQSFSPWPRTEPTTGGDSPNTAAMGHRCPHKGSEVSPPAIPSLTQRWPCSLSDTKSDELWNLGGYNPLATNSLFGTGIPGGPGLAEAFPQLLYIACLQGTRAEERLAEVFTALPGSIYHIPAMTKPPLERTDRISQDWLKPPQQGPSGAHPHARWSSTREAFTSA